MNTWSLICSTFRHYKSPFHTVIRIHLISLSYHILVILPSHFSSMEQMLILMLMENHGNNFFLRVGTLCFPYRLS